MKNKKTSNTILFILVICTLLGMLFGGIVWSYTRVLPLSVYENIQEGISYDELVRVLDKYGKHTGGLLFF